MCKQVHPSLRDMSSSTTDANLSFALHFSTFGAMGGLDCTAPPTSLTASCNTSLDSSQGKFCAASFVSISSGGQVTCRSAPPPPWLLPQPQLIFAQRDQYNASCIADQRLVSRSAPARRAAPPLSQPCLYCNASRAWGSAVGSRASRQSRELQHSTCSVRPAALAARRSVGGATVTLPPPSRLWVRRKRRCAGEKASVRATRCLYRRLRIPLPLLLFLRSLPACLGDSNSSLEAGRSARLSSHVIRRLAARP